MTELQQISTLTRQIGRLEGIAMGLIEQRPVLSAKLLEVSDELQAVLDDIRLRGVEDAAPYEGKLDQ